MFASRLAPPKEESRLTAASRSPALDDNHGLVVDAIRLTNLL
jgi:hypothetical protein